MKRVVVLADVHGNLPALAAVLAEPEVAAADLVISAGDAVAGPMPVECFDALAALGDRVLFVRGNADREVVARSEQHGSAWCARLLGEERLARIAAWPLAVSVDVDAVGRVLVCHAVPSDDYAIVTRVTPDAEFEAAFAGAEADVAACGHTHIQFDRPAGRVRVVNAGSVGAPYEGRRGAFWLLLGPGIEHRRTEYDTEAAVAAIRATEGPTAEELAGWLLDPPDPDEISAYFESLR
ncbi:MAG: metallophosphatase family protein [Actinomycetota bacterium]|nr:metallophosphatase family protein [Actinomycetota bacterium]